MKKLLGLFILLASFNAAAADFWVEVQATRYHGGKGESQVLGVVSGNIAGPLGYFVLGQLISDGYQQVYAGPSLKLGPIEVGLLLFYTTEIDFPYIRL